MNVMCPISWIEEIDIVEEWGIDVQEFLFSWKVKCGTISKSI